MNMLELYMISPTELPHSFEAENAVIAALLTDNNLYDKIADFLHHVHFYDPLNQRIFKNIVDLIQKGSLANKITIWPSLYNDAVLKERGGEDYFNNLCQSALSISYIYDYAFQVFDAYMRRETIKILTNNLAKCYTFKPNESAATFIEGTESALFALSKMQTSDNGPIKIGGVLKGVVDEAREARKNENRIIGIPTGFIDLDRHLGGLHKSDLLILAGRPSMGKTSLGTTMGFYAAKACGIPVAFFSLEMSAAQLATRILGQEAMISPDKIRRGMLSQSDEEVLIDEAKRMANVPFFIDDTPALTIAGLRSRARRLKKQENIGLIIIDYLQLIHESNHSENRVQELSFITRSLKTIAKELDVPILALSQLSRAVEQREDRRPQLADLRESGTIEQDSDVVMFIFRESYYEARKKPPEGSEKMRLWQEKMNQTHNLAELMIAKQRHGPIKNIRLYYEDSLAKFGNYVESVQFIDNS